jgi:NADH-quinone oxidoreductase subunit M
MDFLRFLLILLLAVPAVAAVVVALLGHGRAQAIRLVSLAAVVLDLLLAVALTIGFINARPSASEADDVEALARGLADWRNQFHRNAPDKRQPKDSRAEHNIPPKPIATFAPEIVPGADAKDPHKTTWHFLSFGNLGAVQFYLGLDGLNIWLLDLTALLMFSAVLISWTSINDRVNEYFAWLLLLGTGMFGVFLAFDIILFYVFFELTLVPLFFLIGLWGGPERRYAARKFFIYTLAGSVITFLGLLAVVLYCYQHPADGAAKRLTFSIPELVAHMNGRLDFLGERVKTNAETFGPELASLRSFQYWVFFALMAGFAIKVPLVPVHTWLPLAHVEAPTAGSVLLAGVLLKIGAYGFLRLCLPLTPDACLAIGLPLIGTLAVIGIIYGAFCALAQDDIKKLVAYSSVSHLGFCMLGMFALNHAGIAGSLLQMINHGLSTGALFILVGMLYERYHTRKLSDYSGMGARLGLLTVCMVYITLSSIGLPGLNGFVGEALCFFGMYQTAPAFAILGSFGIVLGAWYMLSMVKQVFFGPLHEPAHEGDEPVTDVKPREWAALAPIMVLCLLIGMFPQPLLNTSARDLKLVADIQERAKERSRLNTTSTAKLD